MQTLQRPWPWTAWFWLCLPAYLYGLLFVIADIWWITITTTVVAFAASMMWVARTNTQSRTPRRRAWHVACATVLAAITLVAVLYGVRDMTRTVSRSVGDTMDPRSVNCGTVLRPIAADQLVVSLPDSYPAEAAARLPTLPTASLDSRCDSAITGNRNFVIAAILGGLVVASRSLGHTIRARKSGRTVSERKMNTLLGNENR
ncbi:hypothetical protein [Rhodococcus sp. NBC_00297]|uniref:hypothetical protein n=1 Tax=Rhodococcus sp. NBC_00297 TaxID=2976005 RepID=UPI002E292509|nr:hypothetical protein [Rhodococcus sp. NBC_00297]